MEQNNTKLKKSKTKLVVLSILLVLLLIGLFMGYGLIRDKIKNKFIQIGFIKGPSLPRPLEETRGFSANSDFQFTISPNDEWMVYHEGRDKKLILLNLINKKKFTLLNEPSPFLENGCWSQDSKYCVKPTPNFIKYRYLERKRTCEARGKENADIIIIGCDMEEEEYPNQIIDISNPDNPQLNEQTYRPRDYTGRIIEPEKFIKFSELNEGIFTCSDCYDWFNEENILRSYISEQYLNFFGNLPVHEYANNIISHNGEKIYYQKGLRTKKSTLYEFDVSLKKNREIASFSSLRAVTIKRLRLSPNQKYLAFQVSYGKTWVTPPTLYVVELENKKIHRIADNVYYDVHWTSKSDKLFFYKCKFGGACGEERDLLYYVEF